MGERGRKMTKAVIFKVNVVFNSPVRMPLKFVQHGAVAELKDKV